MIEADEINLPDVLAEIRTLFDRYEAALVGNDIETLDGLFWASAFVLRYGSSENLYGIEAIRAFRQARSPVGLARVLRNTVITTYGRDLATTATEFFRENPQRCGRQTQTWVRLAEGWRVVAGHVSIIDMSGQG